MKIQWTTLAVEDLESIRNYIARDSDFYASSFIEKILHTVDKIGDLPEIGRMVPEANSPNIREVIFQNYRIIYRILHDSIQLIGVIRGSRDLSKWPLKPWEII
mgnify:CR=1 FL=1|jgi:addiction module RelE/StbE family toxin